MITLDDILTTCGKHRDRLVYVDDKIRENAVVLAARVNRLLDMFGHPRRLTSGFRDPTSNAAAGGAKYSWHMRGCAADIDDVAGKLGEWLTDEALQACELWAENPRFTPGWVHVQTEPPLSGKRRFKP